MSDFVEIYGGLKNNKSYLILNSSESEVTGNLTVLEDLDVYGNIYFNNTDLSSALANLVVDLTGGQDASFSNIDITGSLKLNNIDISGKLTQIDVSLVDFNNRGNNREAITDLYDLEPNIDNSSAIISQIANKCKEPWWLNYGETIRVGSILSSDQLNFSGKFKGGVLAPNGKIIFVPDRSPRVGIYDPETDIYIDGAFHNRSGQPFSGGVLAPNGKIIFVPFLMGAVGIYDPITDNYTDGVLLPFDAPVPFRGGVLAPNGKIIFVPNGDPANSSKKIGIYDPVTNIYQDSVAEHHLEQRTENAFRGGVLAPNGKIIFVPCNSDYIGIYDPIADKYIRGPAHSSYGFHVGVLASNGKVILIPSTAGNGDIGIYDPYTNIYTKGPYMGVIYFQPSGAVLAPNGKIIIIPDTGIYSYIYDPNSGINGSFTRLPTQTGAGWCGGVLAPNGKIIFVPNKINQNHVLVYGNSYPLRYINDTLAPYFSSLI